MNCMIPEGCPAPLVTPEPGTLFLIFLGFGLLVIIHRWKNKNG